MNRLSLAGTVLLLTFSAAYAAHSPEFKPLAIATHGVIFAEGNAGTVQEIFQDACQNYYGTYGTAAPMILFGQDYWDPAAMPVYANDKRKKAFPLVRKLAEEKGFTHRLIVTDSLREIVRTVTAFKP